MNRFFLLCFTALTAHCAQGAESIFSTSEDFNRFAKTLRRSALEKGRAEGEKLPRSEARAPSQWFSTTLASPIDDSQTIILTCRASKESLIEDAELVIRRKEGRIETFCIYHTFLDTRKTRTVVRWDKQPATTTAWNVTTDGDAVCAPGGPLFVRAILGKNRLVIRASKYNGGELTAVFDLAGLREEIAKYPSLQKTIEARQ